MELSVGTTTCIIIFIIWILFISYKKIEYIKDFISKKSEKIEYIILTLTTLSAPFVVYLILDIFSQTEVMFNPSNLISLLTVIILLLTLLFQFFSTREERKLNLLLQSLTRYEKFISNMSEPNEELRETVKQHPSGITKETKEFNSETVYYYGDHAISIIFAKAKDEEWDYGKLRYEKAPIINSFFDKLYTCIIALEELPKNDFLFFQKRIREVYKKVIRDSITYQQQCLLYLEKRYIDNNKEGNIHDDRKQLVQKINEYQLIYELGDPDKESLQRNFSV